jgi:O-acetyl-ADP-ribose deacetylase (regulator of RNase III)
MLSVIEGDITLLAKAGEFDILLHGAHCHNYMGHGVAASIAQAFPDAFLADQKTPKGDVAKMGTYSYAVCKSDIGTPLVILNGYTQYYYGAKHYQSTRGFDYDSFRALASLIARRFAGRRLRFGFPLIGGDRGNADPIKTMTILMKYLRDEDLILVLHSEPGRKKQYTAEDFKTLTHRYL